MASEDWFQTCIQVTNVDPNLRISLSLYEPVKEFVAASDVEVNSDLNFDLLSSQAPYEFEYVNGQPYYQTSMFVSDPVEGGDYEMDVLTEKEGCLVIVAVVDMVDDSVLARAKEISNTTRVLH